MALKSRISRWTQLPERGNRPAIALITWIGLRLGRRLAQLLLYPIAAHYLITGPSPRRGSRLYQERLRGRPPTWWELFRHFHTFAATLLDRVYLLVGQYHHFDIRVHNGQLILDQVASGRGGLLLGSHLGSFEALRVLGVGVKNLPVRVLMDLDHNQIITRFLATLNADIAATAIAVGQPDTLIKVKESIDGGELVGTLGDRVVGGDKAVRCQFLGAEADFPAAPIIMATLLKCPVILCFALYRGNGRYDVYFEPFADAITLERHRRSEALAQWVQRYADRLAHYTRLAPYNWFNFYDFWALQEREAKSTLMATKEA